MPRVYPIAVALLAVISPVQGTSAQAGTQQRDSAGVRIVVQAEGPVVALSAARPRFTLDGTEGGRQPFYQITGVVALRDGIVVANAGTHELRFYGRDGSLRSVVGRQGSGPGEFRIITWIQVLPGDSLLAYDGGQRRMSLWTARGEYVRDIPVVFGMPRVEPGFLAIPASPLGMFSDREFYFIGSVAIRPAPELQRATGPLVRSTLTMQESDTIANLAVMDMQPVADDGRPRMREIAFPRMLRYAFGEGEFAITDGADYRIDRYSRTGRLQTSVRVERKPVVVSRRDRELYLGEKRDRPGDVLFGAEFPAYSDLWYDRDGRLWAGLYRRPSAEERLWDVFDSAGKLLITLRAPASLQLVAADADQVYAIHTDDLDVPTLRAFDLPRELSASRK